MSTFRHVERSGGPRAPNYKASTPHSVIIQLADVPRAPRPPAPGAWLQEPARRPATERIEKGEYPARPRKQQPSKGRIGQAGHKRAPYILSKIYAKFFPFFFSFLFFSSTPD